MACDRFQFNKNFLANSSTQARRYFLHFMKENMPRKVISIAKGAVNSDVRAAGADPSYLSESDNSRRALVGKSTHSASSSTSDSSDAAPSKPVMRTGARGSAAVSSKPSSTERSSCASRGPLQVSPTFVVRTESVKRGRRTSFRVTTSTTDEERSYSSSTTGMPFHRQREVISKAELIEELGVELRQRKKLKLDLSQHWDNLVPNAGARSAPLRGLLGAGAEKKLALDLSNHRPGALRKGAEVREKEFSDHGAWLKAFKDMEAGLLVEALTDEIARISRNPSRMPQLELICRDQPLFTAVYPLLKSLAQHARALPRLKALDLNRYSRSADVCEAHPPTDRARLKAYDKFIDRIAHLLEESPSLRELGLRMNGVDSFALAMISDALSVNQVLERLDLSGNPLCTETSEARPSYLGLRVLTRALRRASSMTHLDLSFCGLDARAADLLVRALAQNKKLAQINLGGNPIPPSHAIFQDSRVVRIVKSSE
jgi:hypothetical protein